MVWLNNVLIPEPTGLKIGIHRISRAERAASGLMTMEIIAIKRTVALEYGLIRGADLDAILANLESRVFHTLRYPDPQGGERTITVYTGDIDAPAWHVSGGVRWWEGVTIGLVEQ